MEIRHAWIWESIEPSLFIAQFEKKFFHKKAENFSEQQFTVTLNTHGISVLPFWKSEPAFHSLFAELY